MEVRPEDLPEEAVKHASAKAAVREEAMSGGLLRLRATAAVLFAGSSERWSALCSRSEEDEARGDGVRRGSPARRFP